MQQPQPLHPVLQQELLPPPPLPPLPPLLLTLLLPLLLLQLRAVGHPTFPGRWGQV